MDALTRLHYLTHHYQDLQGYRLFPFAVFFLIGALYDLWAGFAYGRYQNGGEAWFIINGLAMLTAFIVAAMFSHRIGQWYVARYGYVAAKPGAPRAFTTGTWLIFVLCSLLLGLHSLLLLVFGLMLVLRQVSSSPARLRHIPLSVLYLMLGCNFPGVDSGLVSYPAPGSNSYVVIDLIAACLLLYIAFRNHQLLERLSPRQAVLSEEK